jgi:hypothetical protein
VRYVIDPRGKRIAVIDGTPNASPKKRKRKPFKAQWVKLPLRWVEALQKSKSAATWQLAMVILFEAFKCEQIGGEIVLSSKVTKMSGSTRRRSARGLAKLGLIETEQNGKEALRVTHIYYLQEKKKRRIE